MWSEFLSEVSGSANGTLTDEGTSRQNSPGKIPSPHKAVHPVQVHILCPKALHILPDLGQEQIHHPSQ